MLHSADAVTGSANHKIPQSQNQQFLIRPFRDATICWCCYRLSKSQNPAITKSAISNSAISGCYNLL